MDLQDYQGQFGFFDGEDSRNNITNFLTRHAFNTPDKKALLWVNDQDKLTAGEKITAELPHESISFSDFNDNVNRLTRGLKASGIQKGDRVILFLPMSRQLYEAMNAIAKVGAVSVFLDSWARRDQLASSANTVSPKAMITFEMAFQYCSEVPELDGIPIKIVVGDHKNDYTADYDTLLTHEPDESIAAVKGDDTALITFTTGSSGTPKGADRTHQFLAAQHLAIDQVIPYKKDDIDLPAFPIFSLNNIAAGVTTVIPCTDVGQPKPDDAIKIASQILSCNINCATLSIAMINGLSEYVKTNELILAKMDRVVTGGAPISKDLLQAFKVVVPNSDVMILYGSTEAEPMAHIEARDMLFPKYQKEASDDLVEDGVNVGHFADGIEAKFIKIHKDRIELTNDDWTPYEIEKGAVGELLVSGLHVCKRYYNNEEATKDTKVYESTGKVWHRTGDLGYQDEHGQVWIVGRVHNVIVRKSIALFPVKAEIILKRLDFVEKSAFVGLEDQDFGEKTWAVVSPKKPLSGQEKENGLKEIEEALSAYDIPVDHVAIADTIPMDPRHHSKVEYPVLREQIINGEI